MKPRTALTCVLLATQSFAETPPWNDGSALGDKVQLEKTTIYTDDKGHYVVVAPDEKQIHRLYWGDEKTLTRVATPAMLSGDSFFEPRGYNAKKNDDFRGFDLRVYSSVSLGKAADGKPTCIVTCGPQETPLTVMAPEKANPLLLAAKYADPASTPFPHELLRDDQGNYYLVDKRVISETENYFRLFVGKKGKLRAQQVLNVVADSAGYTVFTTGGELHSDERAKFSTWTLEKKPVRLSKVSINENLRMIYRDFGVYDAKKLGNPCDVFLTR